MDQITHPLFQALKEFAKTEEMLLVYVNEAEPSEIFIEMLASLREVDFILLQLDCLKDFCQQVVPLGIYHFDSLQGQLMSLESIASEVNGRIHEYQCPFSMAVPTKS